MFMLLDGPSCIGFYLCCLPWVMHVPGQQQAAVHPMQAAKFDKEASQRISSSGSSSIEVLGAMFKEYSHRVAFGYCPAHKAHFVTLTYAQVWERIKVGTHDANISLQPASRVQSMHIVHANLRWCRSPS